jgi:transmembrane sensor
MNNPLNTFLNHLREKYQSPDTETDIAWQRLEIELNKSPVANNSQSKRYQWRFRKRPMLAFFSSAVILLILFSPYLYNSWNTISISTDFGERKELILPDGSTVQLNSGSTLSYKRDFDKNNRNLTFEGVSSGNLKVEVLGTAFNIKNYSEDIEVAVMRGTVAVNQYDSTVTLTKGERTRFEQNQQPSNPETMALENYPGWLFDTLIFEKTALVKVCDELERTFDIQIRLNNPKLENITVSGKINADNLDEALTILSFLIQKKYTYKDDYYVIY